MSDGVVRADLPMYAVRLLAGGHWELVGPATDPFGPAWRCYAVLPPCEAEMDDLPETEESAG